MTIHSKFEQDTLMSAHPRLIEGPWRALSASEQCEFVLRLELHLLHAGAPALTRTHLFLETWAAPLPFYPGVLLLSSRVERPDGAIGVLDVLMGRGVIFCLSGASDLIHAFNAGRLQPLPDTGAAVCKLLGQPHGSPLARLEEPEVGLAYVRFFCGAVRAAGGGFHVVESAEQLARLGVVDRRGELAALIEPMRWVGPQEADALVSADEADVATEDDAGGWSIQAHVVHAGALFETQFLLRLDGFVKMRDDTTLASAIGPVEVHAGLLRSIVPTVQRSRRRKVPAAAQQEPPSCVKVPAHLVLSARDPLLERLRRAPHSAPAVPGREGGAVVPGVDPDARVPSRVTTARQSGDR